MFYRLFKNKNFNKSVSFIIIIILIILNSYLFVQYIEGNPTRGEKAKYYYERLPEYIVKPGRSTITLAMA